MTAAKKRTRPHDALNLRRGISFYLAGYSYQEIAELCDVAYDTVRRWAMSDLWKAEVQKSGEQHLADAREHSKVGAAVAFRALLEVAGDRSAKKADRTAAAKELARLSGLRPPDVQLHRFEGSDADLAKALAEAMAALGDPKPPGDDGPGEG